MTEASLIVKSHMDGIEQSLAHDFELSRSLGHSTDKGNVRESFINRFLNDHVGHGIGIGTGELIDCESKVGDSRNQIDTILYRTDFPKIGYGAGLVNLFFIESVVSTLEIKSTLDEDELFNAVQAAQKLKALKHSLHRIIAPRPALLTVGPAPQTETIWPKGALCYVIAYHSVTKNMSTIAGWLKKAHEKLQIEVPERNLADLSNVTSPTVDGIFVLNQGFLHFDNLKLLGGLDDERKTSPAKKWICSKRADGNLLLLFVLLTRAIFSRDVAGYLTGVETNVNLIE
jgi:hypothetical protein